MKKLLLIALLSLSISVLAIDSIGYVSIGKVRLFPVEKPNGKISAERRIEIANESIREIMVDPKAQLDSIIVLNLNNESVIEYRGEKIISVLPQDTVGTGKTIQALANDWYWRIRSGIATERERSMTFGNLLKLIIGFIFPLLVLTAYFLVNKLYRYLNKRIALNEERLFKGVKFRNVQFIPPRLQANIVQKLIFLLKWILLIIVFYLLILVFFQLFPPTKSFIDPIIETSLNWSKGIVGFLGKLAVFILQAFALYIVARILWGLSNIIFKHCESSHEAIRVPESTLDSMRILTKASIVFLYIVGLVAIIPGRGIYIAFGLVFIFVTIIGIAILPLLMSIFAGLALVVFKHLSPGDIIAFGDFKGKVKRIGILWTRIETLDGNELILLNSYLIKHPFAIVNQENPPEKSEPEPRI